MHFVPYRVTALPLIRITTTVPSDLHINILCVCVVMPISFPRKERLLEQVYKVSWCCCMCLLVHGSGLAVDVVSEGRRTAHTWESSPHDTFCASKGYSEGMAVGRAVGTWQVVF